MLCYQKMEVKIKKKKETLKIQKTKLEKMKNNFESKINLFQ